MRRAPIRDVHRSAPKYDTFADMPPDVLQSFCRAMQAVSERAAKLAKHRKARK